MNITAYIPAYRPPATGITGHIASVIRSFALYMSAILTGRDASRQSLEQRFAGIIRDYDPMITRICFGYSRSEAELDDLHQDALINIWQGLEGFKGDSSLKTWIYRVTLNTCVSTLRARHRQVTVTALDDFYNIIDEDADRRRLVSEMHECISQLSPIDKAIILLWLDDFSYDEIAATMGMGRNAVASRLHRAKDKLLKIK